jgi:hypothetical protein
VTVDEDAVLLAIGGLKEAMGQTDKRIDRMELSLGREIRDLKDALKDENKSCRTCRDGIDQALDAQALIFNGRLDKQDEKIKPIESLHTGETAVKSWQDRTLGEIATSIGAGAGIIALVAWIARGIYTGDWY